MSDPIRPEIGVVRKPTYPILPLLLNRWSPRAMTGEELAETEIFSLFEAARWAPSAYNSQPWRFLYGRRNTEHWSLFFDLLNDFNKKWCEKAALLGVIISKKIFDKNNKPSITHSFDTGAAWENLCLEGTSRELIVHGMEGFHYDQARAALKIPEEYDVLAMFAVGKRAPKETLPSELAAREVPSGRKELSEIIYEGIYTDPK